MFRVFFYFADLQVFSTVNSKISLCLNCILYRFLLGIQAVHFDRDDINLPGFHKFFKESSEEELKHAHLVIA